MTEPTQQDFLEWRSPRFGTKNPEDSTNPFWTWAIQTEMGGYEINELMEGGNSVDEGSYWSFERFGMSQTELPDGSVVYIGGGHEDFHDSDFYIYNDVILRKANGEINVFTYPKAIFPPTDFHSATLVGDKIIIIGSLGCPDQRHVGITQVLSLDLNDWAIQPLTTTDGPGWISSHQATLSEDGKSIFISNGRIERAGSEQVDNFDRWKLDLTTLEWECVEKKNWHQYRFSRTDQEPSNIWQLRLNQLDGFMDFDIDDPHFAELQQEMDETSKQALSESMKAMQREQEQLNKESNPELLAELYDTPIPHKVILQEEDEEDIDDPIDFFDEEEDEGIAHCIEIDGVRIAFIETDSITMRVEGDLPDTTLEPMIDSLTEKLSKIENTHYTVAKL